MVCRIAQCIVYIHAWLHLFIHLRTLQPLLVSHKTQFQSFCEWNLQSLCILHGSPRASQSQDILKVRAIDIGEGLRLGQEEVCGMKKSRSYSLPEQERRILEQLKNHEAYRMATYKAISSAKNLLHIILYILIISDMKSKGHTWMHSISIYLFVCSSHLVLPM